MSLQEEIRLCKKCQLCTKMETSPVPPEWVGQPKVMFITDTLISMHHDFEQTPLIGINRIRFIQLIEKYFTEWYITPLVKCSPKNSTYTQADYKICTEWITEEIKRVKPKIIVGCGKVPKYIKCDYETMSAARIIQSKKNEEAFEVILKEISNGCEFQ